jgi:hypothetical protein
VYGGISRGASLVELVSSEQEAATHEREFFGCSLACLKFTTHVPSAPDNITKIPRQSVQLPHIIRR